jgi:Uma2 family endonuclease
MVTSALLTTETYLAQPEQYDRNGNRIKDELIAGEIVLVPPPSRQHDVIKARTNKVLTLFLAANPHLQLGVYPEIAFAVTERDTLVPDVSVIDERRVVESTDRILTGAPEIAIEVVSPSDTAVHVKAKVSTYLAHGSKSVWVFYPGDKSIVLHSARGSREVKIGDMLEGDALPGFSEPVARFFEGL